MYLDKDDEPYFLMPVSEETPHRSWFYFIRHDGSQWVRTRITRTSNPFNGCFLDRDDDGTFRAYLIVGEGESDSKEEMDRYGWGGAVEVWTSDRDGENWKLSRDLTPVKGDRYQNIKPVMHANSGQIISDMVLFYGWSGGEWTGRAYMWDNRK